MLLARRELSAEEKQKVEIVYAIVPRSALSKVVDDQGAALAEETKLLSTDDQRRIISNFSTVVFVTDHSHLAPLTGILRVWTIGGPVTVEAHSLASGGRASVYVIEGGGTGGLFWKKNKRAEWVSLKVLIF
jgi:hypothetical protein